MGLLQPPLQVGQPLAQSRQIDPQNETEHPISNPLYLVQP
jgi:hypothetical protein